MGGLPFDGRITSTIEKQRYVFEAIGCEIADAAPDFTGANEAFMVNRAVGFASSRYPLLQQHRDQLKDTVVWNVEEGLKLTALEIGNAEARRAEVFHSVRHFMETHEFMVFPVSQHPPFDVSQPYITEINGVKMDTYIDWMRSCYYVTVTGHPAISVPCGFTEDGLPVGVQIVGRHQDDFGVLQLAYAFQEATEFWKQRPGVAQ